MNHSDDGVTLHPKKMPKRATLLVLVPALGVLFLVIAWNGRFDSREESGVLSDTTQSLTPDLIATKRQAQQCFQYLFQKTAPIMEQRVAAQLPIVSSARYSSDNELLSFLSIDRQVELGFLGQDKGSEH
jgi:hypothetical protein